ncbi:MAG: tRNA 2-thiouridine(34) synthase MnmA [Candidatus Berkelbacteria bacterium]
MRKKIAVAMSGGVDSSVVAKILKDQGYDCVGLFLKLWSDPTSGASCRKENRCCDYEALEDARMVAAKLDIPFYVIDAKVEFKKEVVDYFLEEYKNLRTPNPCIVCNETIKFDLLLKKALSIGCEKLATGHYARITRTNPKSEILNSKVLNLEHSNLDIVSNLEFSASNFSLSKGIDETKDQSYMLYRLNQNQLSKVMFPIGEMEKKDVRELAVKWNLPVKEKPESQEICFFADRDYRAFLRRYLDESFFQSGDIVDVDGKVIGKHDGLLNYTIGQRRLVDQVTSNKSQGDKKPLYVIGFDSNKNRLIVGSDEEVYKKEMIVSDLRWINPKAISQQLKAKSLSVKIRYRHPDFPCVIASEANQSDNVKVLFKKPQRAVTPGQSAVFYVGDEVIGGGIIES